MKFRRAVSGCVLLLLWGCERAEPRYPIQQTLRFSLTLRNTSGELLRDSPLDVFAPVHGLANQRTESVTASLPYELVVDESGNQTLRLRVTIPPWATEVVNVRAEVSLADSPNRVPLDDADAYLAASRWVQVDDARIQSTARSLGGKDSETLARSAFEWVVANITDPGFVRENRGALWALENRAGDCTEQAFLFTALTRARNIPARTVAGFALERDAVVRSRDYHNWSEVYFGEAWHVADPQKRQFDPVDRRYVAMRVIDPSEDESFASQRFASFDSKLDVRMD